jgi:hypothetical protein
MKKLRTKTLANGRVVPRLNVVIVSGAEILAKLGLPCFHCGKTWEQCKRGRFGMWKRCCAKCNGKRSHD